MDKGQAYWDTKHPKVPQKYRGRPLPNGKTYELDIRHFLWDYDIELETLLDRDILRNKAEVSNDDKAWAIQKWVAGNLRYMTDKNLGHAEYWLYPAETLGMLRGDCEDGAILAISLALCAGVPAWRCRLNAGFVKASDGAESGGHAWWGYCRETDNEIVYLDWCYREDTRLPVAEKPLGKDRDEYFRGARIWFSCNNEHAWNHDPAHVMEGRVQHACSDI